MIKKKLCTKVASDVEGTPDMKFMGIFSENRFEFYIIELACISDSVVIVPISVDAQFLEQERVSRIIDSTGL